MTKHFKDKSGPGVSKFALAFSALLLAGCSDDNSTVSRDDPPVISRTAFLGSWSCSGRTKSGDSQDYEISFLSDGRFKQSMEFSTYTDSGEDLEAKMEVQGRWNYVAPGHLEESVDSLSVVSLKLDGENVDAFRRAMMESEMKRRYGSQFSSEAVEFDSDGDFEVSEGDSYYFCTR